MGILSEERKKAIRAIFDSMEYEKNFENTEKATKWLESVTIPDKSSEIHDILQNAVKSDWFETNAYERSKLLRKLASEIEKHTDILVQLEILSRGILAKDTKNSVLLLSQYFHYYSTFCMKHKRENPTWKPEGALAVVIDDENALWLLGAVLAPALAAGYDVILQTTKLSVVSAFLVELVKKVGISESALTLIHSEDSELQPYLSSESVAIVAIFGDLRNEKYRGVNKFNKKILNISPLKTPMIVFNGSDLDSAVESLIDAAWGYKGMLPWAVNTVLIQEDIFDIFTFKLKNRLNSLKIGNGNEKSMDVSSSVSREIVTNLERIIKKAHSQGIEVFQPKTDSDSFVPTLLIGGRADTNVVLRADEKNNSVTLLAFRSIDEAVSLANNSRQGFGASLWSENIGLVNEVAMKLKVNNVWVNSHGLSTVSVPLIPLKDSGVGYFGGHEGFYQLVDIFKSNNGINPVEIPIKINSSVINAINNAKKAQPTWAKSTEIDRIKIFEQIGEYIEDNKKYFGKSLDLLCVYSIINRKTSQSVTMQSGHLVTSLRRPKGVVAIESRKNDELTSMTLILTAVFEGNAVVLFNESDVVEKLCQEITKRLPNGVISIFDLAPENVKTAASHRELNAYVARETNPIFAGLALSDSIVFTTVTANTDDIYRTVTVTKNVWTDVGESSHCVL